MRLFDLKAGMNPRRVRIFLAEKGIEVPVGSIDMMKGENRTRIPQAQSIRNIACAGAR